MNVALVIAVIALLLVVLLLLLLIFMPSTILVKAVPIELLEQRGSTATPAPTTDTMVTGGNNIYISSATIPTGFTLTIAPNAGNIVGRVIFIKNNSTSTALKIVPGSGVSLAYTATTSDTIQPGALAELVVSGSPNSFLRVT